MSQLDLIRELDSLIHHVKGAEISDYDLEKYLREILSKYNCFHFRTVYRSNFYVVFIFMCENCEVQVSVEYCDCNKISRIEAQVRSRAYEWKKLG